MRQVDRLARMILRRSRLEASDISADERQLKRLSRLMKGMAADIAEMRVLLRMVLDALNVNTELEIVMNQFFAEDMENLRREVEETAGAVNSGKALMEKMSARLKAIADSQGDAEGMRAQLRQFAASLNNNQQTLADAIVANDPDRPTGGGSGEGGAGSGQGSAGGAGPNE